MPIMPIKPIKPILTLQCSIYTIVHFISLFNSLYNSHFNSHISPMLTFLKNWTLPVAIALGTLLYLLFAFVPWLDAAGDALFPILDFIFPLLVFFVLFVTFCKVDFHKMRPVRWHLWVVVFQVVLVGIATGVMLTVATGGDSKIIWEGALACIICPTAAAAAVVTSKLGGDINTMTTYNLISGLVAALLIPTVFPLIEHVEGVLFISAFLAILYKVFLVLIVPLGCGWWVRHHHHRLHQAIVRHPNLGFYLWGVSLMVTTGMTVRNIVRSDASLSLLLFIAMLSLFICMVQFAVGRFIGRFFHATVNAGQALGQKNTAFAIWVACMYLNPVASVGPGCYVLWQNIVNSVEIWHHRVKGS